jgi:glutamate/tyrosine decarboxylase-like PLP-dependent enzyme
MLYGKEITDRLRAIQNQYLSQSIQLNLADWQRRPIASEFTDRAVSLLSPLL